MPIYTVKIHEVLSTPGFEGKQQLRGYIPCDKTTGGTANYRGGPNPEVYIPMGVSGVTIGTGVDLGQTDAPTLRKLGVTEELLAKFAPYLEKRKVNAVYALHNNPLEISKEEADAVDIAMLNHHIGMIQRNYDKHAGKIGSFEELPWQAQAAIVSIQYQRGVGSYKKYPNVWKAFLTRDWKDASRRLKTASMWSGYQSRRRLEGELLEQIC